MAAELVVIGKRHRSVLAEFFLGGVTQRMLAGSRADVLVLAGGPDVAAQARLGAPARALP
jgi:nucleotide-binding universal stress UspA family protein